MKWEIGTEHLFGKHGSLFPSLSLSLILSLFPPSFYNCVIATLLSLIVSISHFILLSIFSYFLIFLSFLLLFVYFPQFPLPFFSLFSSFPSFLRFLPFFSSLSSPAEVDQQRKCFDSYPSLSPSPLKRMFLFSPLPHLPKRKQRAREGKEIESFITSNKREREKDFCNNKKKGNFAERQKKD